MQVRFLNNILLTFVWVALTGNFGFLNFLFGFVLGFMILWVITIGNSEAKYFRILPKIISFFFFFIYELIKANVQVAYDVITPTFYMKPGIIQVPLDAKTDVEITFLANLISLTPGTLSLDVSEDKKILYVHALYANHENLDKMKHALKHGFERRLMELTL